MANFYKNYTLTLSQKNLIQDALLHYQATLLNTPGWLTKEAENKSSKIDEIIKLLTI